MPSFATTLTSRFPTAALLLVLHAGWSTAFAAAPDIGNRDVVEAFVDGAVKPLMQREHSPSGVVAVLHRGDLVLAKGYGFIDVERRIPVDAQTTLFRPGSISKLFTWVSVMQLVERGRLDLDRDVNEYLTQFRIEDAFPGQPVTLRHIMTHTAGFENGTYGYLIVDDPARIMPLAEALERYEPTRVFAPGARVAYSNWATALAGLIVANVSGQDFNAYVEENIFAPLGMTHSTFVEPLPAQLQPHMAKAYTYSAGKYEEGPYELVSNFGPAGAAAVSAADMTKFARAILNGGEHSGARILRPDTLRQMLEEGFTHDPRARGMGLGFIKRELGGPEFENFGHDGGTSAFISHLGLSIPHEFMLFTSFSGPGAIAVHQAFVENFYDQFFPQSLPAIEAPRDFQARGQKYAGNYVSSVNSYTKIESILRALGGMNVMVMPDNTLMVGDTRYVDLGDNRFRQVDDNEQIFFQETEDGRIAGFVFDGNGVTQYFRAKFYETKGYIGLTITISLLVFIGVILRFAFQWPVFRALAPAERKAYLSSIVVAVATIVFFVFATLGVSAGMPALLYGIPAALKIALVFPIFAVAATLVHLYTTYRVWRYGLFESVWRRVRHTIVAVCAVWMLSFYYTWNLIGFNYLT